MRSFLTALLLLLVGSTNPGASDAAPGGGAVAKPAPVPAKPAVPPKPDTDAKTDAKATAKAVLDKQIAAIKSRDDQALAATFAADAIVLVPNAPSSRKVSASNAQLATVIPLAMGSSSVKAVAPRNIVAGTAGPVVWFSADLDVTYAGKAKSTRIRALELVDTASGRAVAGSFGGISAAGPLGEIPAIEAPTPAGPIAKFLTSPTDTAAALSADPNVIIQGTDKGEYAVGPAKAKALLKQWSKLKMTLDGDRVHEVRTKDWGFAMAFVNYPDADKTIDAPDRLTGLVIAVPDGSAWKVVAVHYGPM